MTIRLGTFCGLLSAAAARALGNPVDPNATVDLSPIVIVALIAETLVVSGLLTFALIKYPNGMSLTPSASPWQRASPPSSSATVAFDA